MAESNAAKEAADKAMSESAVGYKDLESREDRKEWTGIMQN